MKEKKPKKETKEEKKILNEEPEEKKTLNEELEDLECKQFLCTVGSRAWNKYRLKINDLRIKIAQRALGK